MDRLESVEPIANSGIIGGGWSTSGGESAALLNEKYLAADGIENVIRVLEEVEDERIGDLDFIELNACAGGCVGGGGQPIPAEDEERYGVRGERLYDLDKANPMRFSHENPDVQKLYSEFLGHPLSEKSEELLHTDHSAWDMTKQTF